MDDGGLWQGSRAEAGSPGNKGSAGWSGAFSVHQRTDKGGRELVSEQDLGRSSSLGLPCLCSGVVGCLMRTGQPCSSPGLLCYPEEMW